ncbi:response regulator [Nocardioides acrostichi]|uniref:Transcriptional regulatory protein n=1 Tax=Nocardioides acrostichi TaxID=2784339 RepID=A0A930V1Z4_9ACTN|nr:response regulator [Nocardioides acrostichi]MBF4162255.1 response regulator [Nocardioides acrostichi]
MPERSGSEARGSEGSEPVERVSVLVVEDDARTAAAHATYVGRLDGFTLAGVARSAAETVRLLEAQRAEGHPVDLLLLDMNLPDTHGLSLLHGLRASGHLCDVVAVTAARDADVVRRAVAQGVVLYLIKPFTFRMFRARLEQYAAFHAGLHARLDDGGELAQDDVDAMIGSLRSSRDTDSAALPKGMSAETMRQVVAALREAGAALSASEVAERVGASRVTARRYLEHLAEAGQVLRAPRYGRGGRPELEYRRR